MILICPNCSARFMIDGHALGPGGRTVRCGACAHSWLQLPESSDASPHEPSFESQPPAAMAEAPLAPAPSAEDEGAARPETEVEKKRRRWRQRADASEAARAAEPAVPAEAFEAPPRRRGLGRVLVWFLFVFIVAAILLGGYRYRQDIVGLWPPATKLYQVLGISVDPPSGYWLRVPQDSIKFRRESEGGIPILVVSGEILNQSDKPQRVAPMRILLLDKENRVLRTERVKIDDRTLDPGKRLPFQTSIPNSPPEAAAVRITFDISG
jgi:predicted Zn finger-like uncharacterized protein